MNCPICSNTNHTLYLSNMYDDRYGYPEKFSVYQCNECMHKFLTHTFSSADLENLYTNYYPRSDRSINDYSPLLYKNNNLKDKLKNWFNGDSRAHTYVPKNIKILDIGCGFGESLAYHVNRGCEAYGVEADSNIQKVKDKFDFNIKVGLFNHADYEASSFDYVTMDQVLEHVVDPIDMLSGIAKILKKHGKVIVTIPNANGWGARLFGRIWVHWHTPYHLQFFSQESMKLLAKKTGYKIIAIQTNTTSEWLHYQWMSLVSQPQFGGKSLFWNGQAKTVCKHSFKFLAYVFFVLMHKLKINHIITRFFDAIGCGDGYTIIMQKK